MRTGPRRRPVFRLREEDLLFEDRDLVVVNKPPGLLAVPIPGSRAQNVRDLLDARLPPGQRVGTVHRIDRYTSGLLVFAKNRPAQLHLIRQFREHTALRFYLALVRGRLEPSEGELRHHLMLTAHGFRQVVVRDDQEGGALAISRFRVLERLPDTTLVEAQLITGLKNQLRVQFRAVGHPVVGDRHYEPSEKERSSLDRQALHAHRLGFVHPRTKTPVEFSAPLPPDFVRLLKGLA
jgi:23S rRNA pseudouridine1911/1915/1917 synthase